MLLFVAVALNTSLIGYWLLPPLLARFGVLHVGFERSLCYLRCRLSQTRERAFRRRSLLLARDLVSTIGYMLLSAICFSPSLLLAQYQTHWTNALLAGEAIAGMLVAAIFCAWRLVRP